MQTGTYTYGDRRPAAPVPHLKTNRRRSLQKNGARHTEHGGSMHLLEDAQ